MINLFRKKKGINITFDVPEEIVNRIKTNTLKLNNDVKNGDQIVSNFIMQQVSLSIKWSLNQT
jgi:hypothetical protein